MRDAQVRGSGSVLLTSWKEPRPKCFWEGGLFLVFLVYSFTSATSSCPSLVTGPREISDPVDARYPPAHRFKILPLHAAAAAAPLVPGGG